MADTVYALFGKTYRESQAAMLARVFQELLDRHPQMLPEALENFSCLSDMDLGQNPEALRRAVPAFSSRRTLYVEGKAVCLGTSCSLQRKLGLISRLFRLCGEDAGQFRCLGQGDFREETGERAVRPRAKEGARREICYRLFGEEYCSTQAEMMYRVFGAILHRQPQLADWAVASLPCVSRVDYTLPENRGAGMPPAFRHCRMVAAGEDSVCVGSDYNLKNKQMLIDRLRQQAGLAGNILLIRGGAGTTPRQMAAAEAAFVHFCSPGRRQGLLCQPPVFHLAPVSRRDRIAFLERMADTPERRERLRKIQRTHDLVGLAAKPLFLNMMRSQLDNDHIQSMDMAGIYQDYAEQVLARKYRLQLVRDGDFTEPAVVCRRLLRALEELALCLQRTGADSISLETFRSRVALGNLAQFLWDSADPCGQEAEEDAESRLSNRSLLKYDCLHPDNRCFCHRSMKEYFAARGIVRLLAEDEAQSRELLMTCAFSYEILEFAGKALRQAAGDARDRAVGRLTAFAHETGCSREDPRRPQLANLGANCVNLLHCGGFGLPGRDWSGLVLDGAVLSGADLSRKDLSGTSLRYAHLDNADLTGCDLRRCDFTGVQFEKSGQLVTFALEPGEDLLLAVYRDGKIRSWNPGDGGTRILARETGWKSARLILRRGGRECVALPESVRFWERRPQGITLSGGVPMDRGTRLLDASEDTALVCRDGALLVLRLEDGVVLTRREVPAGFRACLLAPQILVVWTAREGLELADLAAGTVCARRELAQGEPVTAIGAAELSAAEGVIALGRGRRLALVRAVLDRGRGTWSLTDAGGLPDCGARVLAAVPDGAGSVFAGTSDGAIRRCCPNQLGILEERRCFRLELRCAGALVEGAYPAEQLEALRRACRGQAARSGG